MYLCPGCSSKNTADLPPLGVLKTVYHYTEIIKKYGISELFNKLQEYGFIDLLPVNSIQSFGYLKVGKTPLYEIKKLKNKPLDFKLLVKDDSQNPTYSFKDRASHLVSAYAAENNINTIIAASTGNAGSSLAGICASQNQKAIIIVPENVPKAKLVQIIMYGATPVLVRGNYDTAFELSLRATEEFGWFNRNTAFNPFTIEGKKTVAFEIYSQLNGQLPGFIFVPVGDGVIISGLYKGFEDLLNLGIIPEIPVIVSVQSDKSDNLNRNYLTDGFTVKPATTLADSISVDIPRNYYMTKGFLRKYNGQAVIVTDAEILEAAAILASGTGIFAEPAAATAMAGMLKYKKENLIRPGSSALVLSTGSGLKDLKAPLSVIQLPEPISPDTHSLEVYLKDQML
jgi:threonine synthase